MSETGSGKEETRNLKEAEAGSSSRNQQ